MTHPFAQALSPVQFEAATHTHGPLLILAGAGSGKTRVLTYRMANLILSGEATPYEILAVTFTNKAAREMEHRTRSLLESLGVPAMQDLWISTFHSTGARILRERIELLDYKPFFSIYDDSDQLSVIKKIMSALNINDKMFPAKMFRSLIAEAKMLALFPDEFEIKRPGLMDRQAIEIYQRYEQELQRSNAVDFSDLLFKTYDLFLKYPDVLKEYQDRFRFIMVDEYQDTNHLQYRLIKALAGDHQNLCVVGDEDQSIYSWRGADIRNILDFEADFENAKVVKLEENYRSTQVIVNAATAVIHNNLERKDKTLFTNNSGGDKIVVREESTEYDEARFVVKSIEALRREQHAGLNEFAIFYRTNAQSRVLEDLMRSHSLAYRMVGGIKFYDRMEVKDMLAYLKLIINPEDDVAAKRIVNVPARGIGKTTVERIEEIGLKHSCSFLTAIDKAIEMREVHAGATRKLRSFSDLIAQCQQSAKGQSASEAYHAVLDATQYVSSLKAENTPEAQARIENLEELDNAIAQFEKERGDEATLSSFLEEMALVSDLDQVSMSDDAVTMMTLHISKGLEFPYVFIVGMEDGLFPGFRHVEALNPQGLEEERRLAYVGMTRARQKLFLTYARSRRVWGQEQQHPPSRFIKEIPEELVDMQTSFRRPKFLERFESQYGQAASGRAGAALADEDTPQTMPNYEDSTDSAARQELQRGQRVRHPTFGVGSVFQVEGRGQDQKVTVMFPNATAKKFIVKYARLEVL